MTDTTTMKKIGIEEQTKKSIEKLNKSSSYGRLLFFFGHCTVGFFGLGYFTYKTFLNRKENVYDKKTKKFKYESALFKNICKTVGWCTFFIISSGFILNSLRTTQFLFQQAQKKQMYLNSMRVDPLFQDYYIFQTMEYFGVSQKLQKKAQNQFRKIKQQVEKSGQFLEDEQLSLDKQLVKIALVKQKMGNESSSFFSSGNYFKKV